MAEFNESELVGSEEYSFLFVEGREDFSMWIALSFPDGRDNEGDE